MKSISIRNIPEPVYAALQKMAKQNHRSLQEQVKRILEQEVHLAKGSPLGAAARWRQKFKQRRFSDTVSMIREDRKR
jgi:plasmid stability protein